MAETSSLSPKLGCGLLLCIESILDGKNVHFRTLSSFLPYWRTPFPAFPPDNNNNNNNNRNGGEESGGGKERGRSRKFKESRGEVKEWGRKKKGESGKQKERRVEVEG